jgi:predicted transcriptional regulator
MWWAVIGLFLRMAAKKSYERLAIRKALEGEPIRRFMKNDPVTVEPTVPLKEFVEEYIYRHHFKMFPVVEDGNRLLGCVTTRDVKDVPNGEWERTNVGEIAKECTLENTIESNKDATEALAAMSRNGTSRLMVVEKGRLVGMIALKDLLEFFSLKVEFEH